MRISVGWISTLLGDLQKSCNTLKDFTPYIRGQKFTYDGYNIIVGATRDMNHLDNPTPN